MDSPHASHASSAELGGEATGVSAYAVFPVTPPSAARAGWRARLPVLVLAATLLLTAAASRFVYVSLKAADVAQFDVAVRGIEGRVARRLDAYEAMLLGARGLFAASRDVTADEFHAYVARLELSTRFEGIRGIGFSRLLDPPGAPRDSASLVAALRAGGSPADSLWPRTPRAEHHAVVFLEPLDRRNRAALGFDMHVDETRRIAMDRARDQGRAAASGAVMLVQEIERDAQQGFLIYLPVYAGAATPPSVEARRAALRGFVYAPFRAGDLFNGIVGADGDRTVAFRVFDGADTVGTTLLYRSPGIESLAPSAAPFLRRWSIDVAGETWTFVFTPRAIAEAERGNALVVGAVALFGITLAIMLFRVMHAEMRARESAERADALRSRFFAAMSHELRTPVNAVLGYNDLLLAGVYGALAPPQEHGIQRSQRAARHLLELVNDVLDLSKLEAGKMEIVIEPVALGDLLEDLLVTIRPMAGERGCDLQLDAAGCAETIETDPRRLRQVLLNLLSNATKFGAGHPVVVRCERLPHGAPLPGHAARSARRRRTAGDAVVVSVIDRGPGIARADQERIFEEFVQLPGSVAGGTGLGLPISRRLVELLGGHLAVESTPGRGSTFSVTLPIKRSR